MVFIFNMEDLLNTDIELEKSHEYCEELKNAKHLTAFENDLPEFVDINEFSDKNPERKRTQIFHCNYCKIKYKKLEHLQLHKYIHETPKYCALCDTKFKIKYDFKKHINEHIKKKVEEDRKVATFCDFCKKSFKDKKSRDVHVRVHTNERPYKCNVCGKGFKQRSTLRNHRVTHTNVKAYTCTVCPSSFTTSSALKRHVKQIHESGKMYICKICNIKFPSRRCLADHNQDHHPNTGNTKVHECLFCPTALSSLYALKKHKEKHVANGDISDNVMLSESKYQCILCGEKLPSSELFSQHRNQHLDYNEEDLQRARENGYFTCKLCHKKYVDKRLLFKHMHFHMDKNHKCDICQEYYTFYGYGYHKKRVHDLLECALCKTIVEGKGKLAYHYKKVHPSADKIHPCHICGKYFKHKRTMHWHITMTHKSANSHKHKCIFCGKLYSTQVILNIHIGRMHHISAKFKCDLCNASFPSWSKLLRHNDTYHSEHKLERKKSAICKLCHHAFRSVGVLQYHLRKKHKIVKPPIKHQCKFCLKSFKEKKNHMAHIKNRVCTKFSTHKCTMCPREFAFKSSLNTHMIVHSSFHDSCRFCGKKFKRPCLLANHIAKKHPGENVSYCGFCDLEFDTSALLRKHRYSSSHRINLESKTAVSEEPEEKIDVVDEEIVKEEHEVKTEPVDFK